MARIVRHAKDVDRTEARGRLERRRADVLSTLEPIRARLRDSQLESGGEVALADQHPADAATETESRELDLTRQVMLEARVGEIDDALDRVERGAYGRCVACGRPIPAERLELLPETPYCVTDAAANQR